MATNDENSNVGPETLKPRWLLRRQANRAQRVFERHKQRPPIAAFEATLPPAVAAFNQADERIGAQEAAVSTVERPNTEALRRVMRATLGMVDRDLPGFDPQSFTPRSGVPDDVVDNSRRLLEVLHQHTSLPYGEQVRTELGRLIEAAAGELEQGQAALAALQELRREGRLAAATLQKELVAFRRALRAVLGPSHRDVMTLRDKRTLDADDDEADVATPVATTQPATASSSTARASNPPVPAPTATPSNGGSRPSSPA